MIDFSCVNLVSFWKFYKNSSSHFRIVTIPVHALFLISLLLLFKFPYPFEYLSIIFLLWFIFSCLGIAIGYHRLLSHRSFETYTWVKRLLAFWGSFACQGSPVFWVAVHRGLHHPFADQVKDPHTPTKGFFYSYLSWQAHFSTSDFNPKFAIDLIRDPFLRNLSLNYYKVFWFFVGLVFLLSWKFFFFALIPAMIISSHQENIVNSFCHSPWIGYKNFETNDNSRNIWLCGVLFFGQGFHNNHHARPSATSFAYHWWEFDICPYICFFLKKENKDSK